MIELIQKLQGLAQRTTAREEAGDDFAASDFFSHAGDAYGTGADDGETLLAREILRDIHKQEMPTKTEFNITHVCADCGQGITEPFHACLEPIVAARYIHELREMNARKNERIESLETDNREMTAAGQSYISQLVEQGAILESVMGALKGEEPSDFMRSFPDVEQAWWVYRLAYPPNGGYP